MTVNIQQHGFVLNKLNGYLGAARTAEGMSSFRKTELISKLEQGISDVERTIQNNIRAKTYNAHGCANTAPAAASLVVEA